MQSHRVLVAFVLALTCACANSRIRSPEHAPRGRIAEARSWTDRLVDPVTAPTTFETPLIHTSLNGMALLQDLPSDSIFGGGDLGVYALQIRYALSDRLGFIANKDGYIDFNPDVGKKEEGLADLAAGIKYAWIDDPEEGVLVTPGFIYESASGNKDVFQGNGNGILRPFVSAAWDLDKLNVIGGLAYNQALDTEDESSFIDYHLHVDYEVLPDLFPLFEINGITYTDNGETLPFKFEGGDLINLGSTNVKGNSVVTGALGTRYRATDRLWLGLAYEWPLTSREDLHDSRITIDAVLLF